MGTPLCCDKLLSLPGDKLFAERESLKLIVRVEVGAISHVGGGDHPFQTELTEKLTIFYEKWDVVGANFQHGFRPTMRLIPVAKARVEEAGVMSA